MTLVDIWILRQALPTSFFITIRCYKCARFHTKFSFCCFIMTVTKLSSFVCFNKYRVIEKLAPFFVRLTVPIILPITSVRRRKFVQKCCQFLGHPIGCVCACADRICKHIMRSRKATALGHHS